MIYRNFRQVSTDRWLDVLLTFEKADPQNTPALAHRDQIAAGWGLTPADLKVVDGSADARIGTLLQGPPPPVVVDEKALFLAATAAEKLWMVAQKVGLA